MMRLATTLTIAAALTLAGCKKSATAGDEPGHGDAPKAQAPSPPATNRVDIPGPVRQSLGITFARVESRNVAQTLRVPGRFELLPTARREYRTPLSGRVELLVSQYQRIEAGAPLCRVDSAAWRDLHERIAATQAKVESAGPVREAQLAQVKSLADLLAVWKERVRQLEELRTGGVVNASQLAEAKTTLGGTQAELANVMRQSAETEAQQKQASAELRSLSARKELLHRATGCERGHEPPDDTAGYVLCAVSAGVVESIATTTGGLVQDGGLVLSVVQPELIRFRAHGLQSDLGRLRDGLDVRIAPPQGGSINLQDAMPGKLRIGLAADPDERTVDLIVEPERIAGWARAGVSAHLEITLAGGQTELAIPMSAVVRDGATPIIFRRDPANGEKVIRMEADVGMSDGRWVVIGSGVKEGDEIVVGGNYQLMLATSGSASKGGHFHSDGTFHEGEHK